ncbi:MAG TPA: tetratricopeptide repeat protein [Caldithrix abyssi]|uniref:Tetratricopeptide repeat protein n=1 Tax=Caldithrix abyssi TaxID=187145 RepID=A0A7V4WVE6_CALAY|nr:tetratricopeptide repeat protein [Caldithrix abyssi]
MELNRSKIILLVAGVAFTLYVGNIYFKSLKPPDHIHSRDDVPQGNAQQGPSPQEIKALEARLANEPDNLQLVFELGHIYLNTGQYLKAEEIFLKGTESWPDNAEMLVDLGVAQRGLGKINEALSTLSQATQKFPEYGDSWLQLAVLYRFNLKNNKKALDYFEKYLSLEDEGETASKVRQEIKRIKNEMQQ